MIFFYKCRCKEVTEQIVNPIIVFSAYFTVLKNEANRIEKLRSDRCCN